MEIQKRKQIRLGQEIYAVSGQYFSVTICALDRNKVFNNKLFAQKIFDFVMTSDLRKNTTLSAFCIMPDHIHFLIAPRLGSLVNELMKWKSFTSAIARRDFNVQKIWQRSFFDHAIRTNEDLKKVAEYILNNPVRKGLAKEWNEYEFSWCEWFK